jgi:hypothetical protein
VKCSLLTLSTFIDGELAPERRAEVDAHLVGCARCSSGAATLREEQARVGQLARVTVDPGSAQLMLEQVGIIIDSSVDRSPVIPPPPSLPPDAGRPWQDGTSSPALPWTPRRPDPVPLASKEMAVPTVSADLQPELPLEGVRSTPASWDRVAEGDPPPFSEMEPSPAPPDVPTTAIDIDAADEEWLNAGSPPASWEADPAPPGVATSPHADVWVGPPAGFVEPTGPPSPPAQSEPPVYAPPTRLATASGPAALWARARDAVTVRLALARGGEAIEDSAQIVSGAPSHRGTPLPTPAASTPDLATSSPTAQQRSPEPAAEVELPGVVDRARPAPVAGDAWPASVADFPEADAHDPADDSAWNAFAASSYPVDVPPDRAASVAPRPIGRHTRAIARERVPLSARVARGVGGAAAAARDGASTAATRVRQSAGRLPRSGPDSRLVAGIAAIGLIFVLALLIGHATSHPVTPTASRPSTAPAAVQPRPSVPARSSAAAASGAAVAPAKVQTFGAGDTGFQVMRLRYGAQTNYMRVVFDLGAVTSTAAGTPRVTVGFINPTTVLVTLNGTVPAGSTGTPIPGKVISSVTLVSSGGDTSVYRFTLTRPASVTAFYLTAPTRFVLDLH